MNLLRGSRSQRLDALITVFMILGILLVILAALSLFGQILDVLSRFRQPIFMFILGAILAYLMAPLVEQVYRVAPRKWLAVLVSYLLLFACLSLLAFLLINPFIQQARSLENNLRNPAASSLRDLQAVKQSTQRLQASLVQQQARVTDQSSPTASGPTAGISAEISALQKSLTTLSNGTISVTSMRIPPSYVETIARPATRLAADYHRATIGSNGIDVVYLNRSVQDAKQTTAAARAAYDKAASTPILLLNLQTTVDEHGIQTDLHDSFGKALQQASNQVANIVNNALSIALTAGNLLLNTVLILIISIYFLSDGGRFVRWLVAQLPLDSQDEADYFVTSLDRILGAYLRTQIVMALLAAALAAIGAVIFGVPYAIVIFLSTFLLSLVPVIGPVVLPIPPILIAIIFTPLPRPIFFAVWLLLGEQVATNVIGPRIQGQSVGIHPLEAMAAALVGFPIAGFLGSFFAVPAVAFLHVVMRTFYHARRVGPATAAAVTPTVEPAVPAAEPVIGGGSG